MFKWFKSVFKKPVYRTKCVEKDEDSATFEIYKDDKLQGRTKVMCLLKSKNVGGLSYEYIYKNSV